MSPVCQVFSNLTLDDLNKIVLAIVALVALFLGPFIQSRIAARQVKMQEDIARRQLETQQQIARRQIADNISTKRQVWIDELRKDAAEVLTLFARLQELKRPSANLSDDDKRKNFDEKSVANARAHELAIRIKLRMNPTEDEHNEFDRLMGVLASACSDPPPNETPDQVRTAQGAFNKARGDVISHLQKILKHEWERVKRGDV